MGLRVEQTAGHATRLAGRPAQATASSTPARRTEGQPTSQPRCPTRASGMFPAARRRPLPEEIN